ncbi:MAG: helix-turn-helix transcriptional regulator, partial [Lachnospiraceae bacterium]|nr:helix-turn-helix transcriptional regulator [Lachnospiraceae bacterium]
MGKFSAELDAIMATRDVALAGVIRDTGISRAAFFKYRNGSRLPSDIKTVERLADVLQLNFDERRRFREGYLIDQIGEYKYRGMMAIVKLLCT